MLPAFRGNSGSCSHCAARPPFFPQWVQDLNSQWAPKPRLSANSNRLLAGLRQGVLSRQSSRFSLCYAQGWCGVPSLLSVPCTPLVFTSQTFLPQKYNADYDLSARQGADTLAFMSLLEEKLLPVLVSTSGPSMNSLPLRKAADTHIRETGDLEFHPQ